MSTLADETAGDMPVKDISFSHTAVGGLQGLKHLLFITATAFDQYLHLFPFAISFLW